MRALAAELPRRDHALMDYSTVVMSSLCAWLLDVLVLFATVPFLSLS
jgi:hypothetical protein